MQMQSIILIQQFIKLFFYLYRIYTTISKLEDSTVAWKC